MAVLDRSATMSGLVLPNFLIGGAGQCGTSFLARALRQHPDVFLSGPAAAGTALFLLCDAIEKPLSWYSVTWFSDVKGETAIGEKSTSYLFGEKVAERIAERCRASN